MQVSSQYPNASIKPAAITASEVLPFYSEVAPGSPVCITNEGAVVFFFEIFTVVDMAAMIKRYEIFEKLCKYKSSTLQLYKVKQGAAVKSFGCVKIFLDYSVLKLDFKATLRRFFVGCDDILTKIGRDTSEVVDMMSAIIDDAGYKLISPIRDVSVLHEFMLDCEKRGDQIELKRTPVADMSIIEVADNRLLGMFSLNDIIYIKYSELLNFTIVGQCFSVCIPAPGYEKVFSSHYTGLFSLLDYLALDERKDGFEEEAILRQYKERRLCFYSNTIMISSPSLEKLKSDVKGCRDVLARHGLMSYAHSGSAREHYISCFPANADRGYYYHVGDREKMPQIAEAFFDL